MNGQQQTFCADVSKHLPYCSTTGWLVLLVCSNVTGTVTHSGMHMGMVGVQHLCIGGSLQVQAGAVKNRSTEPVYKDRLYSDRIEARAGCLCWVGINEMLLGDFGSCRVCLHTVARGATVAVCRRFLEHAMLQGRRWILSYK